ncbi:MAG: hypothetical protein IJX13_02555 [Clostridia bacterium]|nr:hypothetical protein [Clostridia bacterium]
MNDNSKNKVCFDCAGTPTIKRIISNMKDAGIKSFVIVIGHQAYSVMDCLDGEEGIVYAYQKEQRGTGHAAMCGLKALKALGYSGPAIISMGDKIISAGVIKSLLEKSHEAKGVFGVQPLMDNFNGGRVITRGEKPFGIVEFADAALMALADVDSSDYMKKLKEIGLNPKKAAKVYSKAMEKKPQGALFLCGETFSANEILYAKYANAGLYCFDVDKAVEVIGGLGSNNAQGEIYLTDALECLASTDDAVIYEIADSNDMLTYSTKTELRKISRFFLRNASEFIGDIENGKLDDSFALLYRDDAAAQKERYIGLLNRFIERHGDKKVIITRSPGRVNLMGRHIDHRGGGINVIATDKDTVFVFAPRDDGDVITISNSDESYSENEFTVKQLMGEKKYGKWLDYLADEVVMKNLSESAGDWSNYVKAAIARAQFESDELLCGMDMVVDGTIPVAAGLSSSSSIVVGVMEAVVALNCLNITDKEFIEMCGEGEWFVGSRGGAGDHAAMKCGKRDAIVHLSFKPFAVGDSASFSDKYAIIVANSMIKAKKSEGSKNKFNAKVASYEFAFMLLKRANPKYRLEEFRDLSKIRPYSEIYKMLKALPEKITREEIKKQLPEYMESIEVIFRNHADPGVYHLRDVALYGISECVRSDRCMEILNDGNYALLGEMMKISHNGDRCGSVSISDEKLEKLALENADIAFQYGAYDCSTPEIDYMCDMLNAEDGVLGSELVGAGLGGCVIALVEKEKADRVIESLNVKYYDKYNFSHAAQIYTPAPGSSVLF